MPRPQRLAPCFINSGTVVHPRDMVRVLETLDCVRFTYMVDNRVLAEGEATLVKLMADATSSTMAVNGYLFINVGSFHYLEFETTETGMCSASLCGDGSVLHLLAVRESESSAMTVGQMRLIEGPEHELSRFVSAEEDEDDD